MTDLSLDPDTDSLDERTVDVASATCEQVSMWAEELRAAMLVSGFEVTPASGYRVSTSHWPGYRGSLRAEHRKFFVPIWHEQIVISTVVVEIHECTSGTCELWTEENPPEFSLPEFPQSQRLEFSRSR